MWRQEVSVTAEFKADTTPRYRQPLLTLAGPNLVHCSHSGTLVAVELRTRRPAWAVRYPSLTGLVSGELTPARDLSACLYHADRVYVAPEDSTTLFCLDAETGRTHWSREGLNPVHLLGVTRGRVLLTTRDGLRAVDAWTGNDRGGWCSQTPAGSPDSAVLWSLGAGCSGRLKTPTFRSGRSTWKTGARKKTGVGLT